MQRQIRFQSRTQTTRNRAPSRKSYCRAPRDKQTLSFDRPAYHLADSATLHSPLSRETNSETIRSVVV